MSTSESRKLSALEEYWLNEARVEPERKDRTVLMGKKYKKQANTCMHLQDKINVGGYTVWVSGSSHRQSSKAPDVGVFMDWAWSAVVGRSVGRLSALPSSSSTTAGGAAGALNR